MPPSLLIDAPAICVQREPVAVCVVRDGAEMVDMGKHSPADRSTHTFTRPEKDSNGKLKRTEVIYNTV